MKRQIFAVLLFTALFGNILMSCDRKEIIVTSDLSGGIGELSIDDIWEIDDSFTLVNEMGYYLSEKCDFGDNIKCLSDAERTIYVVYTLECEVNNGGFAQYFFNSSGNLGNELCAAFEKIGATENAEICAKATDVFGDNYPTDRSKRQDIMMADENVHFGDIWSECDNEFFGYPEDTSNMMYNFIIDNKKDFT